MKKIPLILVILGFLASSCEKRRFEFVSNHPESGVFTINETGSFNETKTLSLSETLNSLDIPDGADIEEVYINSISAKGLALQGNQATGFNIQGTLTYDGNTVNLFNSNTFSITNNEISEIRLSNLNPTAIELIKNFFQAGIYTFLGIPLGQLGGFFTYTDDYITIEVNGTSTPGTSTPIHMQFELVIDFDLTYSACVESLPFMGDDCF